MSAAPFFPFLFLIFQEIFLVSILPNPVPSINPCMVWDGRNLPEKVGGVAYL